MMRHLRNTVLRAAWPERWLADALALGILALALPRIAQRVDLTTWGGFAVMLVTAGALLAAASWAVVAPAPERAMDSGGDGRKALADDLPDRVSPAETARHPLSR